MIAVFLINSAIVVLAVIIHYAALYQMTVWLPRLTFSHPFRIAVGVFGALVAHTLEVWLFAIAFYFMNHSARWGTLQGNYDGSLMASLYFSFSTFTTLGYGDIEPIGDLRYLTGLEALTGLVLITWTASFLFLEMQRNWNLK